MRLIFNIAYKLALLSIPTFILHHFILKPQGSKPCKSIPNDSRTESSFTQAPARLWATVGLTHSCSILPNPIHLNMAIDMYTGNMINYA